MSLIDLIITIWYFFFFFQAEDGIRDVAVTGVQTCALPICVDPDHRPPHGATARPGRPGPARRRHGMRPRRDHPGPHRAPRPRAAEPPRLEVRVEAVGPEALQRPVVCRASGGRAREARPDDAGR